MTKAVKVYDRTWDDDPHIEVDMDSIRVEMKFLPPGTRFRKKGERGETAVQVWPETRALGSRKTKLLKP